MTRSPILSAALLLAACAPGSYGDLSRPTLAVVTSEPGGFCSAVHAVDADGAVWSSGGCGESNGSLERRAATVGAAERAMLDEAMTEILALSDDPECDLPSSGGRRYRFVRTLAGGGEEDVRLCQPGVPLVAVQLADRLEALATAGEPVDAGPDSADAAP